MADFELSPVRITWSRKSPNFSSCVEWQKGPETHKDGVEAQAVPGRARPVPSKTEAKGDLLPRGSEMFSQAHILNSGSSLRHHSVEPLGSVAWLAEGSLHCPDSSLYPISWRFLQSVPSWVDGARPNLEQNKPLPCFYQVFNHSNKKSSMSCLEEEFRREEHTYTHMSTTAPLKRARGSTAGCPAVEGCVRQWAEWLQTGRRQA